jgi:hypothetical protein
VQPGDAGTQPATDAPEGATRLFTVRIWSEPVDGRVEHRGNVRDVATGAFRSFRDWSDLTAFLDQQLEEQHPTMEET